MIICACSTLQSVFRIVRFAGKEVHRRTAQAIIDEVMLPEGKRVYIVHRLQSKRSQFAHIPEYFGEGYARARA